MVSLFNPPPQKNQTTLPGNHIHPYKAKALCIALNPDSLIYGILGSDWLTDSLHTLAECFPPLTLMTYSPHSTL